jgi:uncharacterized membrane protein
MLGVNHLLNKDHFYTIPHIDITKKEWILIVFALNLILLSIAGTLFLENTENGILVMLLFLAIPLYVFFILYFKDKFPKKLYPLFLFLIGLSVLLLMSSRSSHIIGVDIHFEYNLFYNTLINNHWSIRGNSILDACLAISLLPTIYQKMLNLNPEILFKYLFVFLFSIAPILIYLISNKYIKKEYAFLAAFFFIAQSSFFAAETNPRTNLAILFFMLAILVFFSDRIQIMKKRILFILFMVACVLSHYSTSYIFFIILVLVFVVTLLSKKLDLWSFKGSIQQLSTVNLLILFFTIIFCWYAQITQKAFSNGVNFVQSTFSNVLFNFFVSESRSTQVQAIAGQGILTKGIASQVEFIFSWILIACIIVGVLGVLIYRNKIILFDTDDNIPQLFFLKRRIDFEFYIMAFISVFILALMVILPYVANAYSIDRLYLLTSTYLSLFFVIGVIFLYKSVDKLLNKIFRKNIISHVKISSNKYVILILLILIPYFLCVSGFTYNLLGENKSVLLNSNVDAYSELYVTDGESSGAKWLSSYRGAKFKIRADHMGMYRLFSQGNRPFGSVDEESLKIKDIVNGYIYLRTKNIQGTFVWGSNKKLIDKTNYTNNYDTIYDNGGSMILFNPN